jgi:hypothetical protein
VRALVYGCFQDGSSWERVEGESERSCSASDFVLLVPSAKVPSAKVPSAKVPSETVPSETVRVLDGCLKPRRYRSLIEVVANQWPRPLCWMTSSITIASTRGTGTYDVQRCSSSKQMAKTSLAVDHCQLPYRNFILCRSCPHGLFCRSIAIPDSDRDVWIVFDRCPSHDERVVFGRFCYAIDCPDPT